MATTSGNMPSTSPPLTLIVAATLRNGIGRAGRLPWPSLRSEMAYFANVTKRAPSPAHLNAVIMGRKSWESIPPKFRPLKQRINIVLSRNADFQLDGGGSGETPVHLVRNIPDALRLLREAYGGEKSEHQLGHVFIIGGSEVYRSAANMPEAERILLTRVQTDFECDTFFPLALGDRDSAGAGAGAWEKQELDALERWTGQTGLGGLKTEAGVEYEFCMFERKPTSNIP